MIKPRLWKYVNVWCHRPLKSLVFKGQIYPVKCTYLFAHNLLKKPKKQKTTHKHPTKTKEASNKNSILFIQTIQSNISVHKFITS